MRNFSLHPLIQNLNCSFAAAQVYAKEEEVCELQVKLQERDTALKAYKAENGRFADMKDKFKADIASLQQQVWSSRALSLPTKLQFLQLIVMSVLLYGGETWTF